MLLSEDFYTIQKQVYSRKLNKTWRKVYFIQAQRFFPSFGCLSFVLFHANNRSISFKPLYTGVFRINCYAKNLDIRFLSLELKEHVTKPIDP